MAHGFRYVPKQRQAEPPDDRPRCPFCHALLNGRVSPLNIGAVLHGASPHFCKETTPGTFVAPTYTFPFEEPSQ